MCLRLVKGIKIGIRLPSLHKNQYSSNDVGECSTMYLIVSQKTTDYSNYSTALNTFGTSFQFRDMIVCVQLLDTYTAVCIAWLKECQLISSGRY